jgi:hypothetical protein
MWIFLTLFVSAFLLFQVQLVVGKALLPMFGGTPAVWTTCLLFFQALLLAGYGYVHGLGRLRGTGHARRLHRALAGLAVGILLLAWWLNGAPLLPARALALRLDGWPQAQVFALLLVSVGLPYFVLSTTSPLLQHWQAGRLPADKVYRLYAFSNVGSLIGLVSYPILFEPLLDLRQQAFLWSGGFLVFFLGVWRLSRDHAPCGVESAAGRPLAAPAAVLPPAAGAVATWLVLAACSSALLLAVTNELCSEVAAVPFLWMVPLALYLSSFIICFDHPRWYRRRGLLFAGALATFAVLISAFQNIHIGLLPQLVAFSAFLFVLCLLCHGELAARKPDPAHLTLFYLCIAAGSVVGALLVSVVAPLAFTGFWEFNIMVTLVWAVLGWLLYRERGSLMHRGDWLHCWLVIWLAGYLALQAVLQLLWPEVRAAMGPLARVAIPAAAAGALSLLPALAARRIRWAQSPLWPRITVVGILFLAECFLLIRIRDFGSHTIYRDRNFFGSIRVNLYPPDAATPPILQLQHGRINHGFEILHPEWRTTAVSYYGEGSGVYAAITRHPRRLAGQPLRIAVLGLGVGTLAALAEPGDYVRFYEINPSVAALTRGDPPMFSYLLNCKGSHDTVIGDARLLLRQEWDADGSGRFDVIVADAFSSDAVPVHLMTREALQLYQRHLRDADSVVLFNIANRFLDFGSLVANLARSTDAVAYRARTPLRPPAHAATDWMLVFNPAGAAAGAILPADAAPFVPTSAVLWTDSFSNLWQLLR